MSLKVRGLFKIDNGGVFSNDVRVTDGILNFNVSEFIYSGQHLEPALHELPSKDEYEAAKQVETADA